MMISSWPDLYENELFLELDRLALEQSACILSSKASLAFIRAVTTYGGSLNEESILLSVLSQSHHIRD